VSVRHRLREDGQTRQDRKALAASSKYFRMAKRQPFKFRTSNVVSGSSKSTPPSTSAATCS